MMEEHIDTAVPCSEDCQTTKIALYARFATALIMTKQTFIAAATIAVVAMTTTMMNSY